MINAIKKEILDFKSLIKQGNAPVPISILDTEEEALSETESYAHSMMRMMKGQSYVMPSPNELSDYIYTAQDKYMMESWRSKMIYGTGAMVVDGLNMVQKTSGADELMLVNLGHSPVKMVHSAKLIADAYQMPEL